MRPAVAMAVAALPATRPAAADPIAAAVGGVGHNAVKVRGSACGRAAPFGEEDCPASPGEGERK